MCGITGWVGRDADSAGGELIRKMTAVLTHRGPDGEGYWRGDGVCFGHRRLIVVDPEGGVQPMRRTMGDHEYVIVYNGELYNTLELRNLLEDKGYVFFSRGSDTEVLLMAYMEWGTDCVSHLNGIFAFAVWDEKNRRLFLARDRMGVKPLFYALRGQSLIFASELKALLAHPLIQPEIDEGGLSEIFIMGPSRTPGHGIFRSVQELRPGHGLTYEAGSLKVMRYWSLPAMEHSDDLETTTKKVRDLLQDTVRRQLISDVPICTLLSGGLDSSAITALAAAVLKERGQTLDTYSVDYADNSKHFQRSEFQPNEDAPWVRLAAESIPTNHRYVFIENQQLVDALLPSVYYNDLPGMADVNASLMLFSREIKQHATVGLSGECADEIFGGYPWMNAPDTMEREGFPWIRMISERMELLSTEVNRLLRPREYAGDQYAAAVSEAPTLPGEDPEQVRMRVLLYLNITRFMPTLLDRKDRMSMAAGLEVRVPFADHRLVEYCWNIPWHLKTSGGMEKGIMRRALVGTLPEQVLTRKKSPYPKTHNPAYLQSVRRLFDQMAEDTSSPILPLIRPQRIQNAFSAGCSVFQKPWFGQLMNDAQYLAYLLQVNTWMKSFGVRIR